MALDLHLALHWNCTRFALMSDPELVDGVVSPTIKPINETNQFKNSQQVKRDNCQVKKTGLELNLKINYSDEVLGLTPGWGKNGRLKYFGVFH